MTTQTETQTVQQWIDSLREDRKAELLSQNTDRLEMEAKRRKDRLAACRKLMDRMGIPGYVIPEEVPAFDGAEGTALTIRLLDHLFAFINPSNDSPHFSHLERCMKCGEMTYDDCLICYQSEIVMWFNGERTHSPRYHKCPVVQAEREARKAEVPAIVEEPYKMLCALNEADATRELNQWIGNGYHFVTMTACSDGTEGVSYLYILMAKNSH